MAFELIGHIGQIEQLLDASAYEEALALAEKCLLHEPGNAGLFHLAAQAASGVRLNDKAEDYWLESIRLLPNFADAKFKLGLLYQRRKNYVQAENYFRQALALQEDASIHCNLGLSLTMQSRFPEAEEHLLMARQMLPDSVEVLCNLGNLQVHSGHPDAAFKTYQHALQIQPNASVAWGNLGAMLADEHEEEAAEKCLRHALSLEPSYALARINLGYLLLAQGRWQEGWEYHEARFTAASSDGETYYPELDFPQWHGENLTGKSILVWLEQGHGDVIQFCRFLPLLVQQGVTRLTLLCQPPIVALIKPLLGTLHTRLDVMAYDEVTDESLKHDYWTFLLSIPYRCGIRVDNIPAGIPYLYPLPERLNKWQDQLPKAKFRVGLVWKGNARHSNDQHRSLPTLSLLAPLWQVPGVQFVSLQKGQGEDEAQNPPLAQPLLHLGTNIEDFADTAAIISQLDLLICVDTAAAHVAGALGKPCWIMLPEYKTDWRWLRNRTDTPWYPGHVRLFRQPSRGDWPTLIAEVKVALKDYLAASPATS